MSDLIAIAYPDMNRAAEVLPTIADLQRANLLQLDDICYVTKDAGGNVKLHQGANLTAAGAINGGFWGLLIDMLFLMPGIATAIGAATGALTGAATDIGIDDQFMKDLGAQMAPGSSAIFVLLRQSTPDRVIPELAKFGGTVLRTSLSHDSEEQLREAFARAQGQTPVVATTPIA